MIKRVISLLLIIVFTSTNLVAQSDLQSTDTGPTGVMGGQTPAGSGRDIKIENPTTERFFQKGRRFFPANFQNQGQGKLPAQQEGKPIPTLQVNEFYPVGPGDKFLINFWGKIEDNLVVAVDNESNLFIPRVGVVGAKGMGYAEFVTQVRAALNKSLRDVKFTISLLEPRKFKVHVLGAVATPGPVEATAELRAADLISRAGGVKPTGSLQFIEIRRRDQILRLDLLRYYGRGNFSMNPFVTDEDIIFVPDLKDFVTVSGAVVRPGTFEIREATKLSDVVDELGGLSIYADRHGPIRLSRLDPNGERRSYEVVSKGKGKVRNLNATTLYFEETVLQHGDEVFIPSTQLLIPKSFSGVFVTGEVKIPGMQPYKQSASIEEYVGTAGGVSGAANMSAARIYRADGTSVRLTPRMNIEPGDTIYIPAKTFVFWKDHIALIGTIVGLASSVIVLSRR